MSLFRATTPADPRVGPHVLPRLIVRDDIVANFRKRMRGALLFGVVCCARFHPSSSFHLNPPDTEDFFREDCQDLQDLQLRNG